MLKTDSCALVADNSFMGKNKEKLKFFEFFFDLL